MNHEMKRQVERSCKNTARRGEAISAARQLQCKQRLYAVEEEVMKRRAMVWHV